MVFSWLNNKTQVEVSEDLVLSTDTVVSCCGFFRDLHDLGIAGGLGDVVEVDKTHLFKWTYNKSRLTMWQDNWLFGGIGRPRRRYLEQLFQTVLGTPLCPIRQL